ncbi:unnamed protein product, partial [Discosporangium mesarthrocarpum]
YAGQWVDAYPEARSYACPGLVERVPEVAFTASVGDRPGDDDAPEEWGGEIKACFMDCEVNPFTGRPFFNEGAHHCGSVLELSTRDSLWLKALEVRDGQGKG